MTKSSQNSSYKPTFTDDLSQKGAPQPEESPKTQKPTGNNPSRAAGGKPKAKPLRRPPLNSRGTLSTSFEQPAKSPEPKVGGKHSQQEGLLDPKTSKAAGGKAEAKPVRRPPLNSRGTLSASLEQPANPPEPKVGGKHSQQAGVLGKLKQTMQLPTAPLPLLLCALGAGILFFLVSSKPKVKSPAADPFAQKSNSHMPSVDYHTAPRGVVTDLEIHKALKKIAKPEKPDRALSSSLSSQKFGDKAPESCTQLANSPAEQIDPGVAKAPKPLEHSKRVRPPKRKKAKKVRRFLGPGGDLPFFKEEKPKEKQLQLSLATRIPAILDMGVTSLHATTVLARTTADIHSRDELLIPKGTIITGRPAGGAANRLFLKFTRLVLDGQSYKISGVATVAQGLVGIPAIVHKQDLEDRTGAKLAEGALETLKGLTSAAARQLSHGTIRGTDGVIKEAQREHEIDRSTWLEVPAGTSFSIVITGD